MATLEQIRQVFYDTMSRADADKMLKLHDEKRAAASNARKELWETAVLKAYIDLRGNELMQETKEKILYDRSEQPSDILRAANDNYIEALCEFYNVTDPDLLEILIADK